MRFPSDVICCKFEKCLSWFTDEICLLNLSVVFVDAIKLKMLNVSCFVKSFGIIGSDKGSTSRTLNISQKILFFRPLT